MFKRFKSTNDVAARTVSAFETQLLKMIDKSMAAIEFSPNGTVLDANQNFLNALGYELDEIVGQNHSIFVTDDYAESHEYKEFWRRLGAGDALTDQYPHKAKSGERVWIQATYCPLLDQDGTVQSVMQIAADCSAMHDEINIIKVALRDIENGDLTARLPEMNSTSLRSIAAACTSAASKLCDLVRKVASVSENVAATSEEINASTQQLAGRTENQAATLEQTAAALQQLSENAASAADSAREMNQSATETHNAANESRKLVDAVIEAMVKIEASSNKIAQIITVIDDIAFQTNLLALNAGVEAARAGEAGAGFAVVASEVRALANRSSESAQDIKSFISESSDQISEGARLVEKAGAELQNIFSQVESITSHVDDIANRLNEQSLTLNEINGAVGQMDQVTQSNAAMVSETNEHSAQLKQNARMLRRELSTFKTEASDLLAERSAVISKEDALDEQWDNIA